MRKIKSFLLVIAFSPFLFSPAVLYAADTGTALAAGTALAPGTQFKQDAKLAAVKQYKPVKIKLKGDSSGKYSWELSGDNVRDILKVDAGIRRYVKSVQGGGEPER